MTIFATLRMASSPGSKGVIRRMRSAIRIRSDGPEAKAEARNRGAQRAVYQLGRAASPW